VLQKAVPCYRRQDRVTEGSTVLQKVVPCYRRQYCVTEGSTVLQKVVPCYRRQYRVTEGRTVSQKAGLCHRRQYCVTEGSTVLQKAVPKVYQSTADVTSQPAPQKSLSVGNLESVFRLLSNCTHYIEEFRSTLNSWCM